MKLLLILLASACYGQSFEYAIKINFFELPQQFDVGPASATLSGGTITFSPQGAAPLKAVTGKVVPGLQIVGYAMNGCMAVPGTAVYAAMGQAHFEWILPGLGEAVVNDAIASNKWKVAAYWIGEGSQAFVLLGTGQIVKVSMQTLAGMAFLHGATDRLKDHLASRVPNATPLFSQLLDPNTAQALKVGIILARFDKKHPSSVITLPCPAL
jgi:hypothetical protein